MWLPLALLLAACGDAPDRPPFALWDMYLGMPFAALDSISRHDQGRAFECIDAAPGYRLCAVPIRDTHGRMQAVLDSADRTIQLEYATGVQFSEGDNHTLANISGAAQLAWAEWTKVVPPDTTGALERHDLTETWRGGEAGRYTARMVWWGPSRPSLIAVDDELSLRGFRDALAIEHSREQAARDEALR